MLLVWWVPFDVFIKVVEKDILVFFSSRRRHTRGALVTVVQTCALPISSRKLSIRPRSLRGHYPVHWFAARAACAAGGYSQHGFRVVGPAIAHADRKSVV